MKISVHVITHVVNNLKLPHLFKLNTIYVAKRFKPYCQGFIFNAMGAQYTPVWFIDRETLQTLKLLQSGLLNVKSEYSAPV